MIGKRILINDYNFTYGKEPVYINVYGAFLASKGNRYIIYSYDNEKLYYGSFFIRDKSGVIMITNDENMEDIKSFVNALLSNSRDYNIISLDNIENVQIIDEKVCDFSVNLNKLYECCIPKEEVKNDPASGNSADKKSSKTLISIIVIVIAATLALGTFLFLNQNKGSKQYFCVIEYKHNELAVNVKEEREMTFNGKGNIIKMKITYDYEFGDSGSYEDFKNNNMIFKYMEEGDTYKAEDDVYTYRIFRNIDVEKDFVLPKQEDKLISYYTNDGYKCNIEEE